jgi:23S rRNA (adenine2503-C2)-methyltransferase
MKILAEYGKEDLAKVYVASFNADSNHLVEFVESVQPPIPRDEKWVLIISSLFGCPVKCRICDAGSDYTGRLTTNEIMEQIDFMVKRRFPDGNVPVPKLKIQFARMGEPALNPNVLNVLEKLPQIYNAPGIVPSISTIAPASSGEFFERLMDIKNRLYQDGMFQLQFSIHTPDPASRDEVIPIKKWSLAQISDYGKRFFMDGDRKITLNFSTMTEYPIAFDEVRKFFDPETFLIKITPLNPTKKAMEYGLTSAFDPYDPSSAKEIVDDFRSQGFDVILSIGEVEENSIGSNCGQFVSVHRGSSITVREGYHSEKYRIES